MSIAAIILAAGSGKRIDSAGPPKQYRSLNAKMLLTYSLDIFLNYEHDHYKKIAPILLVMDRQNFANPPQILQSYQEKNPHRVIFIKGGESRQSSTYNALRALQDFAPSYVHIHDGARPFIRPQDLTKLHETACQEYGAILAQPLSDSLKRVDKAGFIADNPNREEFYRAQTPQYFSYFSILKAHQKAQEDGLEFTDDAAIACHYGLKVKMLCPNRRNFKITYSEDFLYAQILLGQLEEPARDGKRHK